MPTFDQMDELLKKKGVRNPNSYQTATQSGQAAFKESKQATSWFDPMNPVKAATRAFETTKALGGFAGQQIGTGLSRATVGAGGNALDAIASMGKAALRTGDIIGGAIPGAADVNTKRQQDKAALEQTLRSQYNEFYTRLNKSDLSPEQKKQNSEEFERIFGENWDKASQAYKDIQDPGGAIQRDVMRSGMSTAAATGDVIGGAGQAALGGLAGLSILPAAPASMALGAAGDIGDIVAPEQMGGLRQGASDIGKNIAGSLEGGITKTADELRNVYRSMGYSPTEVEDMVGKVGSSIDTAGAGAGVGIGMAAKAGATAVRGAGSAIRLAEEMGSSAAASQVGSTFAGKTYNLLHTLGESGIAKVTTRMTKEAADIFTAPKSLSGGWLNATAKQLQKGIVGVADNVPFKDVTENYIRSRANAFYKTPLGQLSRVASSVGKGAAWTGQLAYQLSPLSYGVGLTKIGAKAAYRMSKYGYDSLKSVFGSAVAKELSDVPLPDDEIMQATGLASSDQMSAMQRSRGALQVSGRDMDMSDIRELVRPHVDGVDAAIANGDGSFTSIAGAYRSHNEALVKASSGWLGKGLGGNAAFYENTRQNIVGILTNTMDNAASPLRAELQLMATALGKNQTLESLAMIYNRLDQMLQGKKIAPSDLAKNSQALAQLYNTAGHDLQETLSFYDPQLGSALNNSREAYRNGLVQAIQTVGDKITAAPNEAAKRAIFNKEFLSRISGYGAETVAPLSGHIAEHAGDFFENGAIAFRQATKGTMFENAPAWRVNSIVSGDEAKDVLSVGDTEYIKMQRPGVGDAIADKWITVSSRTKGVLGGNMLGEDVINTKSPQAFLNFARAKHMEPFQPQVAIHGDKELLDIKDQMATAALSKQGLKGGEQPIDFAGRLLMTKGKALDGYRMSVGKTLENAMEEAGIQDINLGSSFKNLVADIEESMEVGLDDAGKAVMTGPYLKNQPEALAKIQDIYDQFNLRANDGRVSLKDADLIQQKLDDLPASFDASPTGKLRGALQNAVIKYKENVAGTLPPHIRSLRADYAKVMDAYRTYYKWLGVPDKEFNRFTVWKPAVDPLDKGFRELIDSAEKKGARNLKKLLSDSAAADAEKALLEISTITSGEAAASGELSNFLNIARFDDTLTQMLSGGKNAGFLDTLKRYGVTGILAEAAHGKRSGLDQIMDLQELIKNQSRAVEKNRTNIFTMPNEIGRNTVSTQYGGLSRAYAIPEDTRMTSGYEEDTGAGLAIPDHPTTVPPSLRGQGALSKAAKNVPTPTNTQNPQQQAPPEEYPF